MGVFYCSKSSRFFSFKLILSLRFWHCVECLIYNRVCFNFTIFILIHYLISKHKFIAQYFNLLWQVLSSCVYNNWMTPIIYAILVQPSCMYICLFKHSRSIFLIKVYIFWRRVVRIMFLIWTLFGPNYMMLFHKINKPEYYTTTVWVIHDVI